MTRPLPKWIMYRYSLLWNKFRDKEFNHDTAFEILNKDKMISITLSELKQNGWLEMKLDPNDARKRVYKLKSPDHAIEEMEKDEENNNRRL
jgi:type I restriction enzyme M protein